MTLLTPWGLLALAGVPVIILLYILKQKHTALNVSSLYLWRSALQDMEANAPWQKLKKNILMFLQILAVVLIALILSEPLIKTAGGRGEDVVVVLDCSLSMQSTDMEPTRFEAAKKDAEKLVESYNPNTRFSIIVCGRSPYIAQHLVEDKNKILQEIKDMQVTDAVSDIDAASQLAHSLMRQNPGSKVHWFGDELNPLINEYVEYYSYNRNGDNYAVTMLSERESEDGKSITALSRISNYTNQSAQLDISFYVDKKLFDARRINVGAKNSESIYWKDIPQSVTLLECRIDTKDSLEKDNHAGKVVYQQKSRKVLLLTENNVFLEKVFSVMSNLEIYRTDPDNMDTIKGYDLYIFDGVMPEKIPEDGHSMFFNPPENSYFEIDRHIDHTHIRPLKHSFFNDIGKDMSFAAAKTSLYTLPQWANALMETDEGFSAFEGFYGKTRWIVFGFDLHNTNFPVKSFFPIIMTRATETLIPGDMNNLSSIYAGDFIELPIDPEARRVYIIDPDGKELLVAPPFPVPRFDETTKSGMYTLSQQLEEDVLNHSFFVNPPSQEEFNFRTQAQSELETQETQRNVKPNGGFDLKILILWLLMLTLIIEWWVYTNGTTI